MSELIVYKASAGSGKTYNLVLEYLKLILDNPGNFRHILAVTFTNKATTEMKERIIKELSNIAKGKNAGMIDQLIELTNLSAGQLSINAKEALELILHDYDRFAITTIDRFFQRIVREFAREMGMHGTYEVELDKNLIISEACDRLLLDVDHDAELANWLTEMSETQLAENKDWKVNRQIMSLANEIENQKYFEYLFQHDDIQQERLKLRDLSSQVERTKQWFRNECAKLGEKALELIDSHGLTYKSFPYQGSSFANYFNYLVQFKAGNILPGKRVMEACNNLEKWKTKNNKELHQAIDALYFSGLNNLLCESIQFVTDHHKSFLTASYVSKNLHALGVLSTMMHKIRQLGKEKNTVLISETNQLLKTIISDNDAPFIYEKSGNFFKHFMIDEFQDTSTIQWNNFKPLIMNSLAEGNPNLVVGDVKQSIYRWRNGDWQLLHQQVKEELGKYKVEEKVLKENWRSAKNVVDFNNELFSKVPGILQEWFNRKLSLSDQANEVLQASNRLILELYQDVQQIARSSHHDGEVRVELIDNPDEQCSFEEKIVLKMITDIEQLQLMGYKACDIAILIRENKESMEITRLFSETKRTNPVPGVNYEIVSNDSLFLYKSPLVRFVVNMFRMIQQPWNPVWSSGALHEYIIYLYDKVRATGFTPGPIRSGAVLPSGSRTSSFSAFFSDEIIDTCFPFISSPEQYKSLIKKWATLDPLSMLSELVSIYGLQNIADEQANLQALRDTIAEFSQRETPVLFRFIEWWDERGKDIKLQTGTNRDAITLISIHKSKGLEFPLVFIPFCNWDLGPKTNQTIWCDTQYSEYHQFPFLPVNWNKSLANTDFAVDYFHELLYAYIDNLNLLYVACTRAIEGLFIYSKKRKEKTTDQDERTKDLSDLLNELLANMGGSGPIIKKSDDRFVVGQLLFSHSKREAEPTLMLSSEIQVGLNHSRVLLTRKNYEGFWEMTESVRTHKLNRGKLVHQLLSLIESVDDLSVVMNRMTSEGLIEHHDVASIRTDIEQMLKNPQANNWFNKTYKVMNESSILLPGGITYRPDRVMMNEHETIVVDYKTSPLPLSSHRDQVLAYMKLLESMTKNPVKGFVWYIHAGLILEVAEN